MKNIFYPPIACHNTRMSMLEAMDTLMYQLNDENLFERWIQVMPDQATEDDYDFIADDEEMFESIVKQFEYIMKEAIK